jgi:large subunit ribosomal protein L10
MVKQEKKDFVKELSGTLKDASAVVLVDYSGLSVQMQQELKKRLKEVGATMSVAKNTLYKIAAEQADYPKEATQEDVIAGPSALVITQKDPIAPLQVIADYAREFEIPQFKVGIIEGAYQNKENLEKLSKLPGKNALVAQAMGAISSPLYGLIGTLQGNLQKLVFVLQQASQK